ncbi:hypothetical protein [Streptococcus fryi]
MSNTINLNLGTKALSFNFGAFNLDYFASDKKDKQVQDKAVELEQKVDAYQADADTMNDQEGRKALKPLIDEFFEAMFDADAPQKIYDAVGENTWNYLNVFLQVSATIQKEWKKKLNDDNFKKYLAE